MTLRDIPASAIMHNMQATESYPRLMRRIQGAMIDGLIIPISAIATIGILTGLGVDNGRVKVGAAILMVFLLEPFMVWRLGGTVGHHMVGVRVRALREDRHIGLLAALVRFVVKTPIGLPAFLLAAVTRRRQAVHDFAARSLVVNRSAASADRHEALGEYTRKDEHRRYRSIQTRLFVIVVYWFVSLMAWGTLEPLLVSKPCARADRCTDGDDMIIFITLGVLLLVFVAIPAMGWLGYLPGCRKLPGRERLATEQ